MSIELTIHPDGSLWKDDIKLADAWTPSKDDERAIREQARKLADAIDADIAEKVFARIYGEPLL